MLSDMSMTQLLRRMDRGDITVHGFRSTFRDWAAERTNYPNHVVEMALAHTIANDAEHELNRCFSLDRFEKGRELDEYGIGNWTYKQ